MLKKFMDFACAIAEKGLPALRASKRAFASNEGKSWHEAHLEAQAFSAQLVATQDRQEGVRTFFG